MRRHVNFLSVRMGQYKSELQQHRYSYPSIMPIDPETIDLRLYQFVRLHHVQFVQLIQYQVNRFRDEIEEKRLLQQLERYSLSKEQV